jgi:hypothetical protein
VINLDRLDRLRLQRGAEHLTELGSRTVAEFLAEIADQIGGMPAMLRLLAEYQNRLTPEMIRAARADKFPPRFSMVPRS